MASRPTIVPDPSFNPEKAAEILRKAMKGIGTDEKAIIKVLSSCSADQRVATRKAFKTMYGKDLQDDLRSELGGKLEDAVMALMRSRPELDASGLREAMAGAGTDESALIEILATRTNAEISAAKAAYETTYKRDLEKDIMSETSGHFRRILVSLVQANRNESTQVDVAKAQQAARTLFDAGERCFGTDESEFNRIFMTSSPAQMKAILQEYRKISDYDLSKVIEKEMSGNLEEAFLCLLNSVRDLPKLFATRLHKAMKGMGTDEKTLIRIIASRAELDMGDIKQAYIDTFGKHLHAAIKSECSGDFERLLLAMLGE